MANTAKMIKDRKIARLLKARIESGAEKALDALRHIVKHGDFDEKIAARDKLNNKLRKKKYPRAEEHRTRCNFCGRPRAVFRKYGLCRIHLREAVMRGEVPGLRKASW